MIISIEEISGLKILAYRSFTDENDETNHIICSSPYDQLGSQSLQMRSGSGNQIDDEDDVW